jgi:uncharacterized membrane protein (GlpM family)
MLALKLLLVPAFLGLLTLAERWLGPAVAGWLAGLPLVAGPIMLILALEQGNVFAAAASVATLTAVVASTAFGLAYAHAAQRLAWPLALGAGLSAWFVAAAAMAWLAPGLGIALLLALAALLAAPAAFPAVPPQASHRSGLTELPLRMAAGALLTLAVAQAAAHIGDTWSGLLALFPVLASVLAVFSHRHSGAAYAATLLKAMARGMLSLVAFFATTGLLLPRRPLAEAFGAAALACLAVQLATLRGPWRRAGANSKAPS